MKSNPIPLPSRIALISLCVGATAWSQTALTIPNPGFEDPALDDGQFAGGVVGWSAYNAGSIGTLDPSSTSDYTGEAPEGENIASVFSSLNENGLAVVLSDVLQAGSSYNLSVKVGNSKTFGGFPGYRVQLLANGTVLAEDDNSLTVTEDSFVTSTVNYVYESADAALVGQALEIRLLSKGLIASSEVNFDDVQLTVSLADPVANAGGPYVVTPSSPLQLDGSGSLPSEGQSITLYEWDLNNDDTFDITGETPAAISFSDLQSIYGLALGNNTIQLRVTDSSAATDTATTTISLQLAEVTSGFDFLADASQDDGSNNRWEDVTGNSGLELLLDDDPAVTRVPATTNTLLTHAYEFPGGSTGKQAGALLVDVGTTTERSFTQAQNPADWTNKPVSMEIWFKPDNLAPTPTNGQILFEDGGGTGMGLFLANNQLQFRKAGGGGLVSYNLATDPSALLLGPATDEFIHAVFTYNTATGSMELFVNGVSVGSATPGGNDWSGGDAVGFGTLGGNNVGGIGNGQQNTESFDGQIALIRVYAEQILTPAEVENNFITVRGPDDDPPLIIALNPADETVELYPGITLSATFNEDVQLTGAGSVTIKNLTAATEQAITLPDAQVSLSGRDLVINPASNLAFDSTFAVLISADAVEDLSGNAFVGISDDTVWNISTVEQNLNPPVITVKSPADDVTGVGFGANIVATFDQNLILGTGDIVIKDLLDDSSTQTIAVTDASQVTLSGNVLTINPATNLESGRSYAVRIPGTAVRNFSDVASAGIANDTEWNFTTAVLASQLGILDLTANGGINPNTGEAWKPSDSYHLLYCTMTDTTATATDIAYYNAFVQTDAINQTVPGFENLGTVNWFALGSTTTTNAVDNVIITGAVMNAFNSVPIAANAADMWDFMFTRNRTDLEGTLKNVWTGSAPGGVGDTNDQLGAANGSARRHWSGWTDWVQANNNQPTSSLQYLMGISERLFVYDTLDAIAPNFVSITDNVDGGPVNFPDDSVVYTVTFNEAMLPSTVTAADFGNAGTAGMTINSVVQQEDPAVFQVTVTPTSLGTLQLRINQGTVLTDLNGNPLDTSSAILDDTIIDVVGGTPFQNWADGFAGLTDAEPTLDFDAGGLATGLEWVLGGDPTDSGDDADIAPTFDNTSNPDFFIFTYRRADDAAADANTAIKVEYSSDLAGWTEAVAGVDILITPDDNGAGVGIDLVEVKIRRTLAVNGKLFARLNVVVTSP